MRIAPTLELHGTNHSPIIKKQYQQLATAFNGQISYGTGVAKDNIDGTWVNVTAPVAPNTDFTVNHNLNRIPAGYHVVQKDRAADVYTGSVSATKTQLTLRATVASVVLRIFVFGLLLCLFSTRSDAQGANHTNIAFGASLTGTTVNFINGATITVCLGATLPAPGVACNVPTPIFSNVALTQNLSNPTNADIRGNYSFFAAPGVNYVVSVGGVGFTTYSYIWTAPIVTLGGTALNATNLIGPGTITGNYNVLGQFNFSQGIIAPSIGPSAGQQHILPAVASDTFTLLNASQTLINKVFDISLNTLKTATNVAGHVPRNNGTQYIDAQLAAADLSNGVSGSGLVLLQTSPVVVTPVINGASSGTGIQGTDTKLLTSGTISGVGATLCTDASGGATTVGCPVNQAIQSFQQTLLGADVPVSISTLTAVMSRAVTMPSSGCPCRVLLAFTVWTSTASSGGTYSFWVNDGTTNVSPYTTAQSNGGNGSTGAAYSGLTPVTYANSAVVTFTLNTQSNGQAFTVKAAQPQGNGPNSSLQASVLTSN